MELFLDSADFKEIEQAFQLEFLSGLTTTPTFLHSIGISDINEIILKLSTMVPILHIEALGNNALEIYTAAHRLLDLGLTKEKTVFKIPVSFEGIKACRKLINENMKVNVHLVYTVQQAFMAMSAGATYVCPLVGRLQDQGHDAISLIRQCVSIVHNYGYNTKIMFSSVRHPEHVRNALNTGVHAITVPWKVMSQLTENVFTTVGTEQFFTHTKLITLKVKDIIRSDNPTVNMDDDVLAATVKMTESGLGAVTVIDNSGNITGIFTDGDLRRSLKTHGKDILNKKMSEFKFNYPITIDADELINEAVKIIKEKKIDNIVVTHKSRLFGMLDIQDLIRINVI